MDSSRKSDEAIISWLLEGDASIQYQVYRDLLGADPPTLAALQRRISQEGWGAGFLARQGANGHWGRGFYQPKWTSTHYTLLDLKCLGLSRDNPGARRAVQMMFDPSMDREGAVNYAVTKRPPDVCINGMALGYASYFRVADPRIHGIVDYLLRVEMPDHGWNCEFIHGATHSSMHSTISVLEGLLEYRRWVEQEATEPEGCARDHSAFPQRGSGCVRLEAIRQAEARGVEFILCHRLFLSDHTNEVIKPQFLMLSYPSRWHYDILRGLDYFQAAGIPYDDRMAPALAVLVKKRRTDGTWPLQRKHPGNVHFDMEQVGEPSRWNTLRALRVMKAYAQLMPAPWSMGRYD